MRTISTYRKSGRLFILRVMGFNTSDEGGLQCWTISPPGRRTSQMNRATLVTTSAAIFSLAATVLQMGCGGWSTSAAETPTGTGGPATSAHTVDLSWTASTSSDVSGYNIYRAPYTSSCGSFSKINPTLNTSTLYTDSDVTSGASYCYATTAVNASNQESSRSNILTNVQIPST